jgi:hypothetical protein
LAPVTVLTEMQKDNFAPLSVFSLDAFSPVPNSVVGWNGSVLAPFFKNLTGLLFQEYKINLVFFF